MSAPIIIIVGRQSSQAKGVRAGRAVTELTCTLRPKAMAPDG